MTTLYGSGQTNGVPLLLTAITQGTAQTLHTAPVGIIVAHRIKLFALNEDTVVHTVYVQIANKTATNKRILTYILGLGSGLQSLTQDEDHEFVLNGEATIKVWTDTANKVSVSANVDNQSDVSGTTCQSISSGLVAAVQANSRYAVNAQAGVGQATEANADIIIAADGVLTNLIAFPDAAVGGGCVVDIYVRKNGASTALHLLYSNGTGTVLSLNSDSVQVLAGDKICFAIVCDNAGAPAANFHAAVQYIAN